MQEEVEKSAESPCLFLFHNTKFAPSTYPESKMEGQKKLEAHSCHSFLSKETLPVNHFDDGVIQTDCSTWIFLHDFSLHCLYCTDLRLKFVHEENRTELSIQTKENLLFLSDKYITQV